MSYRTISTDDIRTLWTAHADKNENIGNNKPSAKLLPSQENLFTPQMLKSRSRKEKGVVRMIWIFVLFPE